MNKFLVAFAIVLITACGSNDKPVVEREKWTAEDMKRYENLTIADIRV